MHVTRSGNFYNISNNQNPNTDIPQLQAQITQLTFVLEQINHRMDVMDERRARDEFGPHNRRVCGPPLENEIDGSEGDEDDEEYKERNKGFGDRRAHFKRNGHEFPWGQRGRDFNHHPFDERTRGMKVDVPGIFRKLDSNAFEDWLTAIDDYFDWFSLSEDRKVCYIRMKLKGHARAW